MIDHLRSFFRAHPLALPLIIGASLSILMILADSDQLTRNQDLPLYSEAAHDIMHGDFLLADFSRFAPGWSLYLAFLYAVVGESTQVFAISHVLLFLLLITFVYFLAKEFLPTLVAHDAALLISAWPPFVFQMQNGSSLLFYCVLFLGSSLVFVKAIRRNNYMFGFCSGLILGFAALTDVIALFLPSVFVMWALIRWYVHRRNSEFYRVASLLFLFVCGFTIVVGLWTYRNMLVFERFPDAPLIAKNEQNYFIPERMMRALHPFMTPTEPLLWDGLGRIFLFPAGLHYLDREGNFSYKQIMLKALRERTVADLTLREYAILAVKIWLTLVYWSMLIAACVGILHFRKAEGTWLALMVVGYVTLAVIGTAALANNGFGAISMPSSFLVPIVPFLLVLTATMLSRDFRIIPHSTG